MIEILTVVAILAITLTALLGLINFSLGVQGLAKETTQANNLAQEVMEAVRNFRDGTSWYVDGLGALNPMVNYYPQKTADNPPRWQMVVGQEQIGGFTRRFFVHDVLRDARDNIVESGGATDLNTKKITVSVSWSSKGINRQITLDTYFTNWK